MPPPTRGLRSGAICSVVLAAALPFVINQWGFPTEPVQAALAFGAEILLFLASVISATRGPCIAVMIASALFVFVVIPAQQSAMTLGEAGASMTGILFLGKVLISLVILVIASVSRFRACLDLRRGA